MKLPNNPYMSLMCTEPFCAVCNSRVEYVTKKYKFGRMIIQAAGESQIPCQAWVEKYAVIVLDDYIWDIPSKIYGERADKYFSRFKQHVYINQSESDYIITPRLKGALSRV